MKERTILHSDVNNFFASVECATRPELKDKPVAVAGNPKKRTGIILAKNILAKNQGVKTGMSIWEAKNACPDLICLPPHYELYEKISKRLHEIYLDYTDQVEPLGLDECWLDITDSLNYLKKDGKQIADELRERIKKEFGFSVSVGVSFSKIFAKLGSDLKKPDASTIISKERYRDITYHLPLNSIVGIGGRLERKFAKMNVLTIGDFVLLDDQFLKSFMSVTGVELKQQLLGISSPPILNYFHLPAPKSVGNGSTTLVDIKSKTEITKLVYFLSEKVSYRLIEAGYQAKTISISIKTNEFKRYAKSHTISPTLEAKTIAETALHILDSFWEYNVPVRSIRVRASNLIPATGTQMNMFEKSDASIAIKEIKEKYGEIYRASDKADFLNPSKSPHE